MKPIDRAMIQQINDVANIKQSQDSRPAIEQQNISVVVQKNVETKSEAVTSKDDVENQQQKFDAKEKSDNEYENDKKHKNKKDTKRDGIVFLKGHKASDFDIKI